MLQSPTSHTINGVHLRCEEENYNTILSSDILRRDTNSTGTGNTIESNLSQPVTEVYTLPLVVVKSNPLVFIFMLHYNCISMFMSILNISTSKV